MDRRDFIRTTSAATAGFTLINPGPGNFFLPRDDTWFNKPMRWAQIIGIDFEK